MGPARPLVDLTPGTVLLEKYRVEDTLGEGGMGVVVRARHLVLDEDVALKVLRDDRASEEAGARFIREAQATRRLRSNHVARVLDIGALANDVPYIVMELLHGRDLGAILDVRGSIPVGEAVDLILQACEALAEAHALGIVHRDIKPANLFLAISDDGAAPTSSFSGATVSMSESGVVGPTLKVLDFGISKSVITDVKLTQTQSMLGTPAYMAPEQMRSARSVDTRADVWSVGAVLYELVEGVVPFEAEGFSELIVKVTMDPPRAPQRMPDELAAIVLRCLSKAPAERFPTMGDLGRALQRFAATPERASHLVDRMHRARSRSITPLPSAAVSEPMLIADAHSQTVQAVVPSDTAPIPRQRRWPRVVAALGTMAIAAAAVVLVANRESEPAAATAPAPAPVRAPVAPAPPAPAPAPLEPAATVDTAAPPPSTPTPSPAPPSPGPTPAPPSPGPIAGSTANVESASKPKTQKASPHRAGGAVVRGKQAKPQDAHEVTVPQAAPPPPTGAGSGSATHPCDNDPYSRREGC